MTNISTAALFSEYVPLYRSLAIANLLYRQLRVSGILLIMQCLEECLGRYLLIVMHYILQWICNEEFLNKPTTCLIFLVLLSGYHS